MESVRSELKRDDSGWDISKEGRYEGPGTIAEGVLNTAFGVFSLGEDGCTIASTVMHRPMHTSPMVLGGFGSFCNVISGFQPLESGFRLFQSSRGGEKPEPEDFWGEVKGVNEMVSGMTMIAGALFDLISRALTVALLWGAYMMPELIALGEVAGVIGSVGGIGYFLSMILLSLVSVKEGKDMYAEVAKIKKDNKDNSKESLEKLKELLVKDPLFAKRLERTTKKKVLDEIVSGELDEKTQKRFVKDFAKKKLKVDPELDPEGAILAHIFLKLDKRCRKDERMIALSTFSAVLIAVGLIVSGGMPLVVVTLLGSVATLIWLSIDFPEMIQALKKGKEGSKDRAVLLLTTALLVGLITVSAVFSTGLVGLVVMTSVAGVCIGLHLLALKSLRDQAEVGRKSLAAGVA